MIATNLGGKLFPYGDMSGAWEINFAVSKDCYTALVPKGVRAKKVRQAIRNFFECDDIELAFMPWEKSQIATVIENMNAQSDYGLPVSPLELVRGSHFLSTSPTQMANFLGSNALLKKGVGYTLDVELPLDDKSQYGWGIIKKFNIPAPVWVFAYANTCLDQSVDALFEGGRVPLPRMGIIETEVIDRHQDGLCISYAIKVTARPWGGEELSRTVTVGNWSGRSAAAEFQICLRGFMLELFKKQF
jgi:hypothetical protein